MNAEALIVKTGGLDLSASTENSILLENEFSNTSVQFLVSSIIFCMK